MYSTKPTSGKEKRECSTKSELESLKSATTDMSTTIVNLQKEIHGQKCKFKKMEREYERHLRIRDCTIKKASDKIQKLKNSDKQHKRHIRSVDELAMGGGAMKRRWRVAR